MAKKSLYSFSDIIIISLLILSSYAFTGLPYSATLEGLMPYFQVPFCIFFIVVTIDLRKVLGQRLHFPNFSFFLWFSFFLAFIASTFIFNFQANSDAKSFFKIISYFAVIFLFFFVFSKRIYENEEFFESFTDWILYISIFVAFTSLILFFVSNPFNQKYDNTAVGFFAHPNGISHVYTVAIPILVYKFFVKRINFVFFIGLFILIMFALLFTFSRAGYIGVFTGLIVLTFFRSRALFILCIVITLGLGLTILLDFITSKGTSSNLSRLLLLYTAFEMIFENQHGFFWGYGVYEALKIFQTEKLFVGSLEVVVDPHNMIMLMGIQFGMIVTFIYDFNIVYILGKTIFKIKRSKHSEFFRVIACLSLVIGLTMQSMLENVIIYPSYVFMALFLIFLGYLYYFCYQKNTNE